MRFGMRGALISAAIAATTLAGGCEVYDTPDEVTVGYDTVDPLYYDGYYQGGFWVWHDHDGHWFHEERGDHERHFNYLEGHGGRGGLERGHGEMHRGGGEFHGGHEEHHR